MGRGRKTQGRSGRRKDVAAPPAGRMHLGVSSSPVRRPGKPTRHRQAAVEVARQAALSASSPATAWAGMASRDSLLRRLARPPNLANALARDFLRFFNGDTEGGHSLHRRPPSSAPIRTAG